MANIKLELGKCQVISPPMPIEMIERCHKLIITFNF